MILDFVRFHEVDDLKLSVFTVDRIQSKIDCPRQTKNIILQPLETSLLKQLYALREFNSFNEMNVMWLLVGQNGRRQPIG